MSTAKVHITDDKEALLIPLYGRVMQSRRPQPILPDEWAEEAIRRVDYDFSRLKLSDQELTRVAIRAKQFDVLAAEYIAGHPDATVLHLGCGLDTRVYRVDPPPSARWFDVDSPDVMDLRRRLFPARASYEMLSSPVTNPRWLGEVPIDRPAMIVAEGVLTGLTVEVAKPLLNALTGHFSSGKMAFDTSTRMDRRPVIRTGVKRVGVSFEQVIARPEGIKNLDPRLELVAEMGMHEFAAFNRLPFFTRLSTRVADVVPSLRQANRLLVYRF